MNSVPHPLIHNIKWTYAEDELQGTAEALTLLTDRPANDQLNIGIVAPNYTWATQMQQACKRAELDATLCIALPTQAPLLQKTFATLSLLANPQNAQARETLLGLGIAAETQDELVQRYGTARGYTLLRALGIDQLSPFAHGLRHKTGDETPAELLDLLTREAEHPSMHGLLGVIPIMDYASFQGTYDWLFLIGCNEGLLPKAAFADAPHSGSGAESVSETLMASQSLPLTPLLSTADTVVISHFTKLDEAAARKCGLTFVRTKQENGTSLAIAKPANRLKQTVPTLPTTEGGQAFLNRLRT